jgi:enoyl-CoA hydratase
VQVCVSGREEVNWKKKMESTSSEREHDWSVHRDRINSQYSYAHAQMCSYSNNAPRVVPAAVDSPPFVLRQGSDNTASSLVLTEEIESGIYLVKLNRPEVLNAMNRELMFQLAQTFDKLAKDGNDQAKVVVLTGEGRSFCSGVDLTDAMSVFKGEPLSKEQDPVKSMERFPYPIIGAINGFAITGGFELALACDILIGAESAVFIDTHAKFGIHPSWGLSQKLPRLIGANRAREVSLSACKIDAQTAEKWGLFSRVVPDKDLLPTCIQIAKSILSNHPVLIKEYKSVINTGIQMSLKEALEMEERRALNYYKKMTPDQFKMMKDYIQGRQNTPKSKL